MRATRVGAAIIGHTLLVTLDQPGGNGFDVMRRGPRVALPEIEGHHRGAIDQLALKRGLVWRVPIFRSCIGKARIYAVWIRR